MDETKEYQNMMVAAKEIRENWKWDLGDFLMHGHHIELVVFVREEQGLIDTHRIAGPFQHPYDLKHDVLVPLPRQDQLQDMLDLTNAIFPLQECHRRFTNWCIENDYGNGKFMTQAVYKFKSMEQLWLAFVMKEKFGKTWNGSEWVNDDCSFPDADEYKCDMKMCTLNRERICGFIKNCSNITFLNCPRGFGK